MNQLIKINPNNPDYPVSARELHEFLESKRRFADWIEYRIKQYDLIEGVEYQNLSQNCDKISDSKSSVGRPTEEYLLSMDCAKELSMVENNDKGKEARRWFIEIEKDWRKRINPFLGMEGISYKSRKFIEYFSMLAKIDLPYIQQCLAGEIGGNHSEFMNFAGVWYVSEDYARYLFGKKEQGVRSCELRVRRALAINDEQLSINN